MSTWLLALHAASTLALTGLIWIVQLVHYPLFARAERESFADFEAEHQRRISWIVVPLMATEALTAAALVVVRPVGLPALATWAGLGLLAVVWASTAFVQVPLHERLSRGFDAEAHRRLVSWNWPRTLAWTLRGALSTWMLTVAA